LSSVIALIASAQDRSTAVTAQSSIATYTAVNAERAGAYAPSFKTSPFSTTMPGNIRLVQTTATGAIDILKILTAFAHGAEGVMVAWTDRATASHKQRLLVLRELLRFVGCQRERLAVIPGAPDEARERAFSEQVRLLGPWNFGDQPVFDLSDALPVHAVSAHASTAASRALQKLAVELLTSGRVDGVLAWGQGAHEIQPTLARTAEQARRLFAGGRGYPNLATLLETVADENVAIVVRPAELACIDALREEGIRVPEHLFLIGQGVQQDRCNVCLPETAENPAALAGEELAAMERWSMAERAAFWSAQFAQCVHCDGCRSACPFQCYTNCLGDALTPHNGHIATAKQTACAHLACAARLAGHCVQCESCSGACPQAVPLYLLHQKASQVLATPA
jgi:coenzyme F420-reducing hydrogenase delta subunit/ferredoxin